MLDLRQVHQNIQILAKGDDNSRREAIHSLKDHEKQEWATAPAELVHALVASLQHQLLSTMKQSFIRREVVIILANIGPRSEPAIPQLIELLQAGNPDGIREAAARALGQIGKEAKAAVDPLIHELSGCRATLAVQIVRALGDLGCANQRVRGVLLDLWSAPAPSPHCQVQVAIAICKLKIDARGVVDFLTSTLVANQEASLRKAAAEALAWCGKNEVGVVPALLIAALTDKDENIRLLAEASLAQLPIAREKAVLLCAKQLKDSPYAETALRHCGPLAVPALAEALGAEEPAIRERAARTLGCFGEAAVEAVPALTTALADRDLEVRLAAAKSLWNVSKNAQLVVPILIELLTEKRAAAADASDARRRHLQTVIEALWRMGPPAQLALPALQAKSKDTNRLISESALKAIKAIAPTLATKAGSR